jgi:hypothetical protein
MAHVFEEAAAFVLNVQPTDYPETVATTEQHCVTYAL